MIHGLSNYLRNLFQFFEDWSEMIADYEKLKDDYIPEFKTKSIKTEDQD